MKAILAHPDVKAEVDREGWQEVFGLGPSRTPGHGVFRGINELKPAHFLDLTVMALGSNATGMWKARNIRIP